MDKNKPAKNELVLTKPKSYSVTENRDKIMAGTTRNCGEKTYKYSSISKLRALYKNDDPPSVEDEEEEDEQDEEEEDADDEDDDDAALFAHGTVGDAAAGDNDDELVDDPVGCSVLGRGAEPLVRTQFLEHPPTLNFGANHLKKWIQHPQKPPIPFLSPHNPHCRGGFWGGVKELEHS